MERKLLIKGILITAAISIGIMAFMPALALLLHIERDGYPMEYETQNVADYGIFVGKNKEDERKYVERYFPEAISDNFQDVRYVYRKQQIDQYSFEVYLEFTLDNEEKFNEHIREATSGLEAKPFYFCDSFQEYVLYNEETFFIYDAFQLKEPCYDEDCTKPCYKIEQAIIAKILVNYEERRVIYVALEVFDGGTTETTWLSTYFKRFDIDPKEYEEYTERIHSTNP